MCTVMFTGGVPTAQACHLMCVLLQVLQMRGDGPSSDPWLAQEANVEVAMLEAENERLREEAKQLLNKQQKLEELAAKHGVKIRKMPARK